jgi:hypothetical protein
MPTCWDWCSQEHEHTYGETRGTLGVRREFMTMKERNEIFRKTGIRVEDHSDRRKVYKEKNLRELEKGEADNDRYDALLEAGRQDRPVDEQHGFGSIDMFGGRAQEEARAKNFNIHERYKYHQARLAEQES